MEMKKEMKKTLYPITEDFLKNYTIDYPPLIPLYRDHHIQEEYDMFRSSDKFFIFIDNIKEILETQSSVLQLNDFPYYTTDNIKHYVLWIKNKINKNSSQNLDKSFIEDEIKKSIDINIVESSSIKNRKTLITYWVNSPNNSSIKHILHSHIFMKIK
jgi:hypothetical protein